MRRVNGTDLKATPEQQARTGTNKHQKGAEFRPARQGQSRLENLATLAQYQHEPRASESAACDSLACAACWSWGQRRERHGIHLLARRAGMNGSDLTRSALAVTLAAGKINDLNPDDHLTTWHAGVRPKVTSPVDNGALKTVISVRTNRRRTRPKAEDTGLEPAAPYGVPQFQ